MSDIAIRVEGLSKQYHIGQREPYKTLRDTLTDAFLSPFRVLRNPNGSNANQDTIWALHDVSFGVKHGEVVGIIGRNGAGKSTLLKILSRITEPTKGRATVHGRVGSLLEVGTGFNPELTGRENIFLNGAILGMKRREIERKFDEIVAFAELEKFMDTPVKRYSSGMYMRLAFSVAAHLEPDILIVDEVLAVGDAEFQKKCLGKMGDVAQQGRTVLFVSHNIPAVMRLCPRAILLENGQLLRDGPSYRVVTSYTRSKNGSTSVRQWLEIDRAPGDDVVRLRSVAVIGRDGQPCDSVDIVQPFGFAVTFDVLKPGYVLVPSCRVINQDNIIVFQTNDWVPSPRSPGHYRSIVWIPGNLMAEGLFYVTVGIATPSPTIKRVRETDVIMFNVVDTQDGRTERTLWGGDIPGIIRPVFMWETVGPLVASDNRVEVDKGLFHKR